jgi:preprotein translocase SecE subunit
MAKDTSKGTVVRRIKASSAGSSAARTEEPAEAEVVKKKSTAPSKKTAKKPVTKPVKKTKKASGDKKPFVLLRPIFAIGRYFRNSWRELRQVRWTNRRATWALTLAVILFCLLFAGLIMLVDWIFNWTIQEVVL